MIERLNAALEGRYSVERELGAGGMATVFLAAERFLAEIRTTAKSFLVVVEPGTVTDNRQRIHLNIFQEIERRIAAEGGR